MPITGIIDCRRKLESNFQWIETINTVTCASVESKLQLIEHKKYQYNPMVYVFSGLGLYTAKALAAAGWHVIMACRDWAKAETAAKSVGIPSSSFTVMHLDLASLNSVRNFVKIFRASDTPLDALVCNAAVYLPQAKQPTFTADGFELSVGTNHLGHFLLVNLMIEDLKKSVAAGRAPRCVMVGSVTGNTNTLAGSIPPRADLGDLSGLARGLSGGHPMIDDKEFDGAKAYKDSKVCNAKSTIVL